MVTPTAESGTAIEKLLQERSRYQEWLARLAAAGSGAPDAVRQRVRTDYEARLQAVMDELRTHSDTVNGDLERFRGAERELERRESEEQERIAEAEVRHAVGEFEESKWQEISGEANRGLSATRTELAGVRAEIARLAEVQGLITAAPAKAAEPEPPPPEEEFEPVLDTIPLEPEPIASPAPSPTPEPAPPQPVVAQAPRVVPKVPPPRADAPPGDELAFLQSVTGEAPAARPPRVSGGHPAPATVAAEPAPQAPAAAPAAAATSAPAAKPGAAPQAKTLKCGECGTLNRPTEWYCERCGAELAAL
jgi:hypothetical protein